MYLIFFKMNFPNDYIENVAPHLKKSQTERLKSI